MVLGPLGVVLLTLSRGGFVSPLTLFIVMSQQVGIVNSSGLLMIRTGASLNYVISVQCCLLTFCFSGQAAEMNETLF